MLPSLLRRAIDAFFHSSPQYQRQFYESLESRRMLYDDPEVLSTHFVWDASPQQVVVTFNRNVSSSIDATDLKLTNITYLDNSTGAGEITGLTVTTTLDSSGHTVATWSLPNTVIPSPTPYVIASAAGTLLKGNYEARIRAHDVYELVPWSHFMAYDYSTTENNNLYYLNGDLNRDREIGTADYAIINAASNGTLPVTFANGDLNKDGVIDSVDYSRMDFGVLFGRTLTPLATAPGQVSVSTGANNVHLQWFDDGQTRTGWRVMQSTDGITWTNPVHLAANVFNYDATTNIEDGSQYYFRVRAINPDSEYWHTSAITTLPNPTDVIVSNTSPDAVDLSWTRQATNEEVYWIFARAVGETEWGYLESTDNATPAFHFTGLDEGINYEFCVIPFNSVTNGNLSVDNIGSGATILKAPTNLGTIFQGDSVAISWQDHSSAEIAYQVRRAVAGGTLQPIVELGSDSTSYTDSDVVDGIDYDYSVVAIGDYADSLPLETEAAVQIPLKAPATVTAVLSNPSLITVNWTDSSATNIGYRVERSVDGDTWVAQWENGTGLTQYADEDIMDGVRYQYRVIALKGVVKESDSTVSNAVTTDLVPASGITISDIAAYSATVNWTSDSQSEPEFEVEVSTGGTVVSTLTVPSGVRSYIADDLSPAKSYTFKVTAVRGQVRSTQATSSSATVPATPQFSKIVAAYGYASGTTNRVPQLAPYWQPDPAMSSYKLQRRSGGSAWSDLATLPASALNYPDNTVSNATEYEYRLCAVGPTGTSAWSPTASATAVPNDPTNVHYSDAPAPDGSVLVYWSPVAGATGYRISITTFGGEMPLKDVPATQSYVSMPALRRSSIDDGLTTFGNYTVAALGVGSQTFGISPTVQSTSGIETVPPLLSGGPYFDPNDTRVPKVAVPGKILLSWTEPAKHEDFYQVYRSFDGVTFRRIATLPLDTKQYIDSGLSAASSYYYKVRFGYNDGSFGPMSNLIRATTPPDGGYMPPTVPIPTVMTFLTDKSRENVLEGDSDGAQVGFFRTNESNGDPLTIYYTVSGTATPGTDYAALSGLITIPAYENSVFLDIPSLTDNVPEGDETVILTIASNPAYEVTPTAAYQSTTTKIVTAVDLDVDSDRNNGIAAPDRSAAEEALEDLPGEVGKLLGTNDDDRDGDGIPDYADGFNKFPTTVESATPPTAAQNGGFVPMVVDVPADIDLTKATFQINYTDPNDPSKVMRFGDGSAGNPYQYYIGDGRLRVWAKDGTFARNSANIEAGGDYIGSLSRDDTYVPTDWSKIGITNSNRKTTLWLEATRFSWAKGDLKVTFSIDPDGDLNGTAFSTSDTVKVTNVDVDVLVGADNINDRSLRDDWVGASDQSATPARQHTIDNWLVMVGPPNLSQQFYLKPAAATASGSEGSIELSNADGTTGSADGPATISKTITTDAIGVARWEFHVAGNAHSIAMDDVAVKASFHAQSSLNEQIFGSESLTIVSFGFEPETYGRSDIPVNPEAVSQRAIGWSGNLFAADVTPATAPDVDKPRLSDKPTTAPDISNGRKFNSGSIQVVWGRLWDVDGSTVKSDATGSPLSVNPKDNATSASDGARISSNLRMRDNGVTSAMETAGGTVRYFLGHPSQPAGTNMFTNNYAASLSAKVIPTNRYPVAINVMQLVNSSNTVLGNLGLANSDIDEILSTANTLLSQASVELTLNVGHQEGPVYFPRDLHNPRSTTDPLWYNTTEGGVTQRMDDLITQYMTGGVIDVFFVKTINSGGLTGSTLYRNMVNGPYVNDDPGIMISASLSTAGSAPRRLNAELGRTLAHEIIHYITMTGDGSHLDTKPWNLFAGGSSAFTYKRDVDAATLTAIRNGISPSDPKGVQIDNHQG